MIQTLRSVFDQEEYKDYGNLCISNVKFHIKNAKKLLKKYKAGTKLVEREIRRAEDNLSSLKIWIEQTN